METENFPVGSRLLPARLRPPVHAFYAVVRAADDIADATDLDPADKHARLDLIEAGLRGRTPGDPRGHALHAALVAAGQTGLERHAIDMLAAFRADIDARPCADWDGLRAYCRSSADPVGRYLLDLHGEAEADREAADALCTALQLLNHGQDLGEDWRDLGRIYLPADWLAEAGAAPDDLGAAALTPGLRAALDRMLDCCETLLARAGALPGTVRSRRLRAEITVIRALALRLLARLRRSDPLATRVAPARGDWLRAGLRGGVVLVAPRRARRTAPGRAA
ncbi:squalene/phytoene synthase family protein [Limimaricola hongkongensis]|uniref:Squalene/phytoene synthase n=2 Tax=Limimaricola hongkongensis TaxID=278132 RepID=A0A017H823_9RHOB|nr:squalene/phytoene synthase family protein [Limimaricola hongkongensis]EYD70450.1 Squalene/phytoene synthase [Limimaricola hongkongensis DSM 17492]